MVEILEETTQHTTHLGQPTMKKMKQNVTQKREKFNHNFSSTFLCYSFCLFIFLVGMSVGSLVQKLITFKRSLHVNPKNKPTTSRKGIIL